MSLCADKRCLSCAAREFCMNYGDEGYFSCDYIIEKYNQDK